MTSLDLRRLRLRPGEVRHQSLELELDAFQLAGQRYELVPASPDAALEITEASGATVFNLAFHTRLSGPCMRCLGHAELPIDVRAREVHDIHAAAGDDDLRSEYVTDALLDLSSWARDAIALELPEQILCRPECVGLCPICGKDLNVEPHEHAGHEADPRWAVLEQLRDDL